MTKEELRVGLAQISPVWLNKTATTEKIITYQEKAATERCDLAIFGEALLPGYPFWLGLTDGARFNSSIQKEIFSHYMNQSVSIEKGDLDPIKKMCAEKTMASVIGIIERAMDRGNHSLYCSRVYIDKSGDILSVHRKLMPTYEERLVWSPGDGHGLQVHDLGPFTIGALNCWENWMPLARSALYALGENLHIAIWPGSVRNTEDITRFIAMESRSYVISVSGLMKRDNFTDDIPHNDLMKESSSDMLANGGSCIAGPDGEWIIEPFADEEKLLVGDLNISRVMEERQNFDPSGHYSRPDITRLIVDRRRQKIIDIIS